MAKDTLIKEVSDRWDTIFGGGALSFMVLLYIYHKYYIEKLLKALEDKIGNVSKTVILNKDEAKKKSRDFRIEIHKEVEGLRSDFDTARSLAQAGKNEIEEYRDLFERIDDRVLTLERAWTDLANRESKHYDEDRKMDTNFAVLNNDFSHLKADFLELKVTLGSQISSTSEFGTILDRILQRLDKPDR